MDALIYLIVICVVLGLVYWLLMQLPIPPPFKLVIQVVVVIICIYFLLGLIGLAPGVHIHRW